MKGFATLWSLKKSYFCQKFSPMQLVIEIKQHQDLQVLLPLLERLKIAYKQVPEIANEKPDSVPVSGKLSGKYAGKLSAEVGEALQQYIIESRNEWERNG
ncbi:MAG: hypothetical protein ACKV1O_22840 [Saprospiraceae bacterium]